MDKNEADEIRIDEILCDFIDFEDRDTYLALVRYDATRAALNQDAAIWPTTENIRRLAASAVNKIVDSDSRYRDALIPVWVEAFTDAVQKRYLTWLSGTASPQNR